jgi:hypothetical protein
MTVMVIRTLDVDRVRAFLEGMGLAFVEEKHGSGPVHHACQVGDTVLEIYPTKKNESVRFIE